MPNLRSGCLRYSLMTPSLCAGITKAIAACATKSTHPHVSSPAQLFNANHICKNRVQLTKTRKSLLVINAG